MKLVRRIFIVIAGIFLYVFITSSWTNQFSQLVYQSIYGPRRISVYESAKQANIQGLKLIDSDRAEESLTYFEQAIEYAREYQRLEDYREGGIAGELFSDGYNNLCLAYHSLGDYEKSLHNGNLAIEILPNDSIEHSNRGNAYFALGKYDEAMEDYNKALEMDNKCSYAYYGKGMIHYNLEEYEKSLQEFIKYMQITPDDIDAYGYKIWCHYYMGNYDEGIETSDQALLIDENNIDIWDAKGYNIMGKSGYREAEIYYKALTERFNDNLEAQLLLGELHYNNNFYMDALEYFLNLTNRFDSNTDLNCRIISCYAALGDINEVDNYFKQIYAARKTTVEFCNYVGDELYDLGHYMKAIKYYDEAIRMSKGDKTAYFNKFYSLFYGKRYARCIEFGKEMIDIFGDDYNIMVYIGESYYGLCKYEDALKWYESAYKLAPDSDTMVSYISDVYCLLEDYENAKKYADQAISMNKNNYTASNVKSTIEKRQRPIGEQIKEFTKYNYLYDVNNQVDQLFANTEMTNRDISNALESVKRSDDIFTFCIYDDEFDYYEEYMQDVEYKEYEHMDYIRIYDFNENTDDQVIEILDSIEKTEDRVLVIDLRMNGGGDTQAANNILDALLPSCVTCTLIDKDGYTYNYYSDASQIKFDKVFVLVDGYTASASELLTLGLKTYLNNVTVIGGNTYGKGVGQTVYSDMNRRLIVFLVSHFWNVREQNIKETGIAPDVHIITQELSDYFDIIKELTSKH